jgi:flap endonuclease-1
LELEQVLKELEIDRGQLISLGILIGTDFNPDGVTGIGPKKALSLVKKYKDIKEIVKELNIERQMPVDPERIVQIFTNPDVTSNYKIEWKNVDVEGVIEFLCVERAFSEERVRKTLEKTAFRVKDVGEGSTLEKWFT